MNRRASSCRTMISAASVSDSGRLVVIGAHSTQLQAMAVLTMIAMRASRPYLVTPRVVIRRIVQPNPAKPSCMPLL